MNTSVDRCFTMYCKLRGKCSKYTPHRKQCGAVGTGMELHYFLAGGAAGTFNPSLPYTILILIPCRHNMADSMCTKKPPHVPYVLWLAVSSALQRATGCFTKHRCAGFWGCFGGGRRVGIDGEALFMHPPCSSRKSVSFSLVCLSLIRTPFAKWRLFFGDTGRWAAAKPAGWGPRRGFRH